MAASTGELLQFIYHNSLINNNMQSDDSYIGISGPISRLTSDGSVMRDFVSKLQSSDEAPQIKICDPEYLLNKSNDLSVNIDVSQYSNRNCNCKFIDNIDKAEFCPKILLQPMTSPPIQINHRYCDVLTTAWWEFDTFYHPAKNKKNITSWMSYFAKADNILTCSNFCYKVFNNLVGKNIPIYNIPYPYNYQSNLSILSDTDNQQHKKFIIRKNLGFKQSDFIFLTILNLTSTAFRKNIIDTINTFYAAFSNLPPANAPKLLIKIFFPESDAGLKHIYGSICKYIRALPNKIKYNILFISAKLSSAEMMHLINTADCYVSLHRGEGLGLNMLDAVVCKKPVICSNYGGQLDVLTEKTNSSSSSSSPSSSSPSYLVPIEMLPLKTILSKPVLGSSNTSFASCFPDIVQNFYQVYTSDENALICQPDLGIAADMMIDVFKNHSSTKFQTARQNEYDNLLKVYSNKDFIKKFNLILNEVRKNH